MTGRNRLCTICARAGSKGVLNKNLRLMNGLPLIAWTILQVRATRLFDFVAVSSDSDRILEIGRKYGVAYPIRRPVDLASDQAAKIPAIQHCVLEVEKQSGKIFDFVFDLDATSPLRSVDDITACVQRLEAGSAPNLITACPARHSPYFNLVEMDSSGTVFLSKKTASPVARRQDAPACFDMNASIYGWRRASLLEAGQVIGPGTLLYEMPVERSFDIDSEWDWKWVELLMAERDDLWQLVRESTLPA